MTVEYLHIWRNSHDKLTVGPDPGVQQVFAALCQSGGPSLPVIAVLCRPGHGGNVIAVVRRGDLGLPLTDTHGVAAVAPAARPGAAAAHLQEK